MSNANSIALSIDEKTLTELVCLARPAAYSFSRTTGIDAEDLLQDVAIRMVSRWEMIAATQYSHSYVRVLARNTMINVYRKVARRRHIAPSVSMNYLEEEGVQF